MFGRNLRHLFFAAFLACLSLGADLAHALEAQDRWFAPNSPWNLPIEPTATRKSLPPLLIQSFLAQKKTINMNVDLWTPAVVFAPAASPTQTLFWGGSWLLKDVPVPPEMFQAIDYFRSKSDSDSSICLYSEKDKKFYGLFAVARDPMNSRMQITVRAGGVFSTEGSGWWDNSKGPWAGRASGASICGGLVRPLEFYTGRIEHALAAGWPSDMVLSQKTGKGYVYPAKTSDGRAFDPARAIPLGARLQLDPSLTDAQLQEFGLKTGDLIIAHAMQKYGVYIVDSSTSFAVSFQSGLGVGRMIYRDVVGNWSPEILSRFQIVEPLPDLHPPLDNRFNMRAPVQGYSY